ncbi:hypothetical protein F5Y16DRAFT_404685 [Xylariaceae sp. FL0255]|nr:hypothetical protein F5Y16DRAFT_404685 [Xylariaceae sp. FL0255]
MLFSIAARRLVSTALATSSRRAAFYASSISTSNRQFVRAFATAKQPSGAKTPRAKSPAKKPTKAKAKAVPKKKPAKKTVKKPVKPKKPVKKVISPEKQRVLERRALRKAALFTEPHPFSNKISAWIQFVTENVKGPFHDSNLISAMRDATDKYKQLSPSELQQLNERAEKTNLLRASENKAWVESHTVAEIVEANKARKTLKAKFDYPKKTQLIHDDRIPTKGSTPYGLYIKARWATIENANRESMMSLGVQFSKEWKSMTPAEKQPYIDLATAESEKYAQQVKEVLGREVYRGS